MATLTETLQQLTGLNSGTAEILASIVLFAVVAVVGWAVYFVFNRYFSKWAEKTETTLDDDIIDAVKSLIVVLVVILGIEYALTPLSFLQPYSATLDEVFLIIEIFLSAFVVARVVNIFAEWYMDKTARAGVNKHHLKFMTQKNSANLRLCSSSLPGHVLIALRPQRRSRRLRHRRHSHRFCPTNHPKRLLQRILHLH